MKGSAFILLCAVVLAKAISLPDALSESNLRTCNCDPVEATQICNANFDADNILIAHENCNMFYKCANGKPVAFTCHGTLLYNPVEEICDWPENVECGDRPISDGSTDDEDCDDADAEDTDNDNEGSSDQGNGNNNNGIDNDNSCNCNPGEAESICQEDDTNGILIAHEHCNQFYKCVNGKPVGFWCPESLLYNPYKELCDWPQNINCGDKPIVVPDNELGDDDTEPDDDYGNDEPSNDNNDNSNGNDDGNVGAGNCDPSLAPTICAESNSEGVLVAHANCNQFYMCAGSKPVNLTCPSGLLFNPFIDQCDWPSNVDCGDRVILEFDEDADDNSDSGSNDNTDCDNDGSENDDDNGGTCNCNPEEAPSICASEGSDGILVAHEECNKFYKCVHGHPIVIVCPAKLMFNPYIKLCDWLANVHCGDRIIPESEDNDTDDNLGNDSEDDDTDNGDNDGSENVGAGNCDPSQAPSICAESDSDGTLVAHENCNQFYMCSGGKPVNLTCPSGLLFNPFIDQCDWPSNVDCGDRVIPELDEDADDNSNNSSNDNTDSDNDGSENDDDNGGTCHCNPEEAPSICASEGSDGILVAHEDCNKFYKCVHGKPVVFVCPAKLMFNPYIKLCDWLANVHCGDRIIPESEDNDTDDNLGNDSEDDDTDNGDNDGSENVGAGNCDPSQAPSICAESDSDGTLVAQENCNQFYMCSGGKPVNLTCPNGLLFNPFIDQCDWPSNVDCGDRVIPELDEDADDNSNNSSNDNTDSDNDGSENDDDNGGTCHCNPEEAPSICASEGSDGILVAHEDCNKFYKCVHGKPVVFVCPAKLMFNPYIKLCDWLANVHCGDRIIPESDEDNDTDDNLGNDSEDHDTDNGDNDGSENVGAGNCDPSQAPSICAESDSDGTLVGHENCNQFYMCSGGKPVNLTCPSGLLFNTFIDQCDWPSNVDCGDRVIPELDEDADDNSNNSSNDNTDSDNDGSENDDDNGGTCHCNPEEAPSICASEGSDGILVAHEDCNKFYKCVHRKPVVFVCPAKLMFNPYIKLCDWLANVHCGDRIIPESEDNDTDDNLGNDSEDDDTDNGDNDGSENVGAGNCDPSQAPSICAESDSDGTLVAHENCNQFHMCSGGKPVNLTCPSGLLFNPFIDQCDWPSNVDCGDRVIPELDEDADDNSNNSSNDNTDSDNDGSENDDDNGGTCHCNPEEAPSICASEGSDGILVAHEDCNKFYKCVHGKPVVFVCPAKLMFNPYIKLCDWLANVHCGDRIIPESEDNDTDDNLGNDSEDDDTDNGDNDGSENVGAGNCDPSQAPSICAESDSDGTLVAHENCNQFYMCSGGKPVNLTCPNGLLFNPFIDQCDWPSNVDCGDRVIPELDEDADDNSNNSSNDNTDSDNDGSENDDDNGGTCHCNPEEAPSICASEGSDGILVAHEDCNKFYKCVHGKPVVFVCPAKLMFNPYIKLCDWLANVHCGDRIIPESEDNDTDDNLGNDSEDDDTDNGDNDGSENVGAGNCDPSQAPSICAESNSDGTLVAHENCNQFYKCSGGIPITLICPNGLLFNPLTDQCDWTNHVDCGDRVIPDSHDDNEVDDDISNENDSNNDEDSNIVASHCDPSQAPTICAKSYSDGVLVAHENCNQFYMCLDGKPMALTCPGDLLFNPLTDQCDWAINVNCSDRIISGPEEDSGSDRYENDDISTGNSNNGTCNCNPSEALSICGESGSDGILIAHENCNQFYMCSNGKPVAFSCYGDLLYNPYLQQCDWANAVDCGDRVIPENNPDNDKDSNETSDNNGQNDPDDNEGNDDSNNDNDDPNQAPTICAVSGSDGVLVAHTNCNQFQICTGGSPVVFTCPDELLFNTKTGACDWPRNVDCGDRVPPVSDDTCTCNPRNAPALCANTNSDGLLNAHENCHQFYQCAGGIPVARECPANLVYNIEIEVCDWPQNVQCGSRLTSVPLNKHLEARDALKNK